MSIELEGERVELVITGPNTGGKTVTLKTVGLLALMAQSGIPVPADRAEFPMFDAVLADIGDYQSIEQNLSTFSAHVTNIDFISRTATAHSLVLLDELGSATDPEEGAALAVAIAEHFRKIGCITVISTHHTSLKVFGANTPGVVNSSVGFDETTLQPTYELRIGVPGASAGINIAQRLGLNPSIIDAARSKLGTQARDVGQFLDSLHENLREAEAERLRLKAREKELEREKASLAAEGRKEQQAKIKEMEKKLETLLRDFEYQAREMVNAVQDRAASQKLSKDAERRISKLRREFSEQFDSTVVAHYDRRRSGRSERATAGSEACLRGRYGQAQVRGTGSRSEPAHRRKSFRSRNRRHEDEDRSRRYCRSDRRGQLTRRSRLRGRAESRFRWRKKTTACRRKLMSSAEP